MQIGMQCPVAPACGYDNSPIPWAALCVLHNPNDRCECIDSQSVKCRDSVRVIGPTVDDNP